MSEVIKYKGCTIRLEQDEDAQSPREWSNVGKMLCRHSRYDLGDEKPSVEEIIAITERKDVIWLPLYLLDHSGLWMKTGQPHGNWTSSKNKFAEDADGWDVSTVGIIYCTKADAIKEWGKKRYTKAVEQKAIAYLQGEVKDYSAYLEGDVIGYIAEDPDGEQIDSCWGFFPDEREGYAKRWDYPISEAKHAIDSWRKKRAQETRETRTREKLLKEQTYAQL